MTDLPDADLIAELRRLNDARTQGEWRIARSDPAEGADCWWLCAGAGNRRFEFGTIQGGCSPHHEANATFIAAVANACDRLLTLAESGLTARANAPLLSQGELATALDTLGRTNWADRATAANALAAHIAALSNPFARARADALREAAGIARGKEHTHTGGSYEAGWDAACAEITSAILARIQEPTE